MKTWKTVSGYVIVRVVSGRSNVFLLTNGKSTILVDSGPGFMWNRLHRRLEQLAVHRIDYLVLTHAHFDHANNAQKIKDHYQAKVFIHEAEAECLAGGGPVMIRGSNVFTHMLIQAFSGTVQTTIACHPCPYDIKIEGLFNLDEFGFNAFILPTPGHSPGSVSIIVDNEIALVGDAMVGLLPWSVYPPFLQDESLLIESWCKLLDTGCSLFLPSHGSANSRKLVMRNYRRRLK